MNIDLRGFHEEFNKLAAEDKIDWKRLAAFSALSGLAAGTLKGFGEKLIEKHLAAALRKAGKKKAAEEIAWPAARGVTSAGSGALFGLGTALGMSKPKKRKE
jgi:hypothetical protein